MLGTEHKRKIGVHMNSPIQGAGIYEALVRSSLAVLRCAGQLGAPGLPDVSLYRIADKYHVTDRLEAIWNPDGSIREILAHSGSEIARCSFDYNKTDLKSTIEAFDNATRIMVLSDQIKNPAQSVGLQVLGGLSYVPDAGFDVSVVTTISSWWPDAIRFDQEITFAGDIFTSRDVNLSDLRVPQCVKQMADKVAMMPGVPLDLPVPITMSQFILGQMIGNHQERPVQGRRESSIACAATCLAIGVLGWVTCTGPFLGWFASAANAMAITMAYDS